MVRKKNFSVNYFLAVFNKERQCSAVWLFYALFPLFFLSRFLLLLCFFSLCVDGPWLATVFCVGSTMVCVPGTVRFSYLVWAN